MYVGCGLTQAPDVFKESVSTLKSRLSEKYHVLEFLGLVAGTNIDVYRHDMACVATADVFIAVCDYPSTGLGVEIERARQLRTPTLAVAHIASKVTRLVLGMAENELSMSFAIYEDMIEDVPNLANEYFGYAR